MLTNDVYGEPGVAVAQISIRPRAHLPSPNVDALFV